MQHNLLGVDSHIEIPHMILDNFLHFPALWCWLSRFCAKDERTTGYFDDWVR